MNVIFDVSAPKKPTNLTVNVDLLKRAKEMKINISSILENALVHELKLRTESEWAEENKESIEKYNKLVEKHGLFSDDVRTF